MEKFDDEISAVLSRYTTVLNKAGMFLDNDIPQEGLGGKSLKIVSTGQKDNGGHLFKKITPGYDSAVYLRYYVKYPMIAKGYIHHSAVRIGGYNPPSDWHMGMAGLCGLGDKRFSVSYEPIDEPVMDAYVYWGDMKSWNGGSSCYGNDFVNGSPTAKMLTWDKWICMEVMVKLNNPVTAYNGELRIWQDGVEVGHWGPGFPKGHWEKDSWINLPADPPFQGFRWRTAPGLNVNYIRIEHYDDTSPPNESRYVLYDNIVMAKKYIGPIKR